MKIVGITGSIASGKSFICSYLRRKKYSVFEADEEVKKVYSQTKVIEQLREMFPECFIEDKIDKKKLSMIVFNHAPSLQKLEKLIHPEVFKERDLFLSEHKDEEIVFIEAPLLFEQGYDFVCNKVIVVYTDEETRKKRVFERQGMTETELNSILQNQISESDKKSKADYLIFSQNSELDTISQIEKILTELSKL
jgi:dephospho-CoA kinase